MLSHHGRGKDGIPRLEGIENCMVFGNCMIGVGDADAAKQAKSLNLATQRIVGGKHERIAGIFRNQAVKKLIGIKIVAKLGK